MTVLLLAVLMVLSAAAIFASCGRKIPVLPEDSSGAADGTEPNTERESETENPDESASESATEPATEPATTHTHAFGDWEVTKEATCTEDGEETRTCACGEKETRSIAAKGHTFGDWVLTKPACTEDGEETRTCACGEKETRPVAKTGHMFGDKPTFAKDSDGNVCTVCTVCGFLKPLSKDETRKAIYDSMPDFVQEVVAYDCSDAENAENYVKVFTLMKEAGITGIVSCCQTLGTTLIPQLLDACTEADIDVYLNMHGMSAGDMVYKLDWFVGGYDCVRGIYLKDEPVVNMFEGLAEAKRRILEEIDGADNWRIAANMLPYGDKAYEEKGWYNTLVEYAETVHPDFICFDRYPWNSVGDESDAANTPYDYVANLLVAKKVADQFGLPLATFLQLVPVGGHKAPTDIQLRCQINLSLACGADTFFLFTVYEGHGFTGVIQNGGDVLLDNYYNLQTIMEEVNAMKGIYDMFDLQKVMTVGCDEYSKALKRFSEAEDYLTDSYGRLSSVETDGKAFVGCMKDDAGRNGYYLVNNQFRNEGMSTYTLTFTEETTYQLWTMDGLVEMGTASSLTYELMCGEGLFLVLGGENVPLGTTDAAGN